MYPRQTREQQVRPGSTIMTEPCPSQPYMSPAGRWLTEWLHCTALPSRMKHSPAYCHAARRSSRGFQKLKSACPVQGKPCIDSCKLVAPEHSNRHSGPQLMLCHVACIRTDSCSNENLLYCTCIQCPTPNQLLISPRPKPMSVGHCAEEH